jgi:hypothetical protein
VTSAPRKPNGELLGYPVYIYETDQARGRMWVCECPERGVSGADADRYNAIRLCMVALRAAGAE